MMVGADKGQGHLSADCSMWIFDVGLHGLIYTALSVDSPNFSAAGFLLPTPICNLGLFQRLICATPPICLQVTPGWSARELYTLTSCANIRDLHAAAYAGAALDIHTLSLINFKNNSLAGPLPHYLARLPVLLLEMSENQFTGTLPDWSQNPNLKELDLSKNQLHGTLPTMFAG
jgi:hypothetical protein